MLYREAGQFKTSYAADQAVFPIRQDRWLVAAALIAAYIAVPLFASEYWLLTIMIPFLVFALAGLVFGFPSLRIKGFYLAVATLASQFFLNWMFNKFPWFNNYSPSGVISAPPRAVFGRFFVTGAEADPVDKYLFVLSFVALLAFAAKNLVRGRVGRAWMAIRDMDIAAEIIGIRPLRTKLLAFAVSSFYCGIAGAMWAFIYTGGVEPLAFDIDRSFQILFMIIIGGLGSILGSFLGAGFIVLLPIFLDNLPRSLGLEIPVNTVSNLQSMIFGALIIFFLIVEPRGLARLWQIGKEKLRLWPFPY